MSKQWITTGPSSDVFNDIDGFMETFMKQYDLHSGALAIAKEGRLVHAKGYSWQEPDAFVTMPTTLFRIASVSKVITGLMIYKLIEQSKGKYSLDSLIWDILPYKNEPGLKFTFDPAPKNPNTPGKYFNAITIRQLLNHQGGWGHDGTDPTFLHDQAIADFLNKGKLPINKKQILLWSAQVQGQQFYPFYKKDRGSNYSNFGYLLLGMVIEQITGMSYINAVKQLLFAPLGITRPQQAGTTEAERQPNEAAYFCNPQSTMACVTGKGGTCLQQYGSENIGNFDAFGGWILSPTDYVKMLAAYRTKAAVMPAVSPENFLTWNQAQGAKTLVYSHGGVLPGTWSYMARREDGVDFMVVWNTTSATNVGGQKATFTYNGVEHPGAGDHEQIWQLLLDKIPSWPGYDLSPAYFNSGSEWGWTAGSPRYDGVWTQTSETHLLERGKTAPEFQELYGVNYTKGMKLIFQQLYLKQGKEIWDGIWAPNPNGQFVRWGAPAAEFEKLYNEWWNKGYRLIHQQAFVMNGETVYNGIWNPATSAQFVSWEKTLAQFHQQYDEMRTKGFRLIHQQSYLKNGVLLYNGIWSPSTGSQFVTWEKSQTDFNTLYAQQWKAGFRLIHMQAVNANGKLVYNGIWNPSSASQYISWTKDDELIDAENIVAVNQGLQPTLLSSY